HEPVGHATVPGEENQLAQLLAGDEAGAALKLQERTGRVNRDQVGRLIGKRLGQGQRRRDFERQAAPTGLVLQLIPHNLPIAFGGDAKNRRDALEVAVGKNERHEIRSVGGNGTTHRRREPAARLSPDGNNRASNPKIGAASWKYNAFKSADRGVRLRASPASNARSYRTSARPRCRIPIVPDRRCVRGAPWARHSTRTRRPVPYAAS